MFFNKKDKKSTTNIDTSTNDAASTPAETTDKQSQELKKDKKNKKSKNAKKDKKERRFKKRYILLLLLLIMITGILVVRFAVLNNDKVENLITSILYNSIGRELDISSFSYKLSGTEIEIKDIVVYNSEQFDNRENARIGRIYIKLSLASLLALNVNIVDISFEDINIYLFTDEAGNWNVPDIKASVKLEEPEDEEYKEPLDLTKLDFLKPKIDVDNIAIKNVNVFVDSTKYDPQGGMKAELKNFDFTLSLHTKRFIISKLLEELSYLPDLYVLNNFETFKLVTSISESPANTLVASTDESGNMLFNNSMLDVVSTFLLNLSVEYPKDELLAVDIFADFPDLDAKYEGQPLEDLGFSFNFENEIDIETMSVWIDDLSLHLFNDRVLGFKGHFLDLIYPDDIDIMLENERGYIDLVKVNRIAKIVAPDLGMNISGDIIVEEIRSKGSDKNLDNDISILINDVDLNMSGIALRNLNIKNTIKFNYKPESFFDDGISLKTYLTLDRAILTGLPHVIDTIVDVDVNAPLNGVLSIGDALNDSSIKPNINIAVNQLSTRFNQASIKGQGVIRINEPFDFSLDVVGFSLRDMTDNFLRGTANVNIDLSGSLISALDISTKATVNNFSYNMGGDISRQTSLRLDLKAFANLVSQDVDIRSLDVLLSTFFNMNTTASLKGLGLKSGILDIKNIRIAPYSMKTWLSPNFAALLDSLNFNDDIYLKNRLSYTLNLPAERASVLNRANINIADDQYPLEDLVLIFNGDVNFSKNMSVNIGEFELSSQTNNFYVKAKGYAAPDLNKMDLTYDIKLDNEHMILPSNINLGGLLAISGNLKDSYARGKFESKNFFFGIGTRGNESMLLEGLNGGFNYNFDIIANRSGDSGTSTSVNRYKALTQDKPNLFFDLFKLNINVPGLIDDAVRVTDFKAVFDISSHAVAIKDANASLYIGGEKRDSAFYASVEDGTAPKRGAISIPWLIFDMGNFSPNTFKYDMRILASDVNLKYLLPAENRDNVDEDKVLVNFTGDIAGVGVSPLRSINLNTFFLGINKMSLEFSKFLVEMIKPMNPSIETVENIIRFGYDPSIIEFNVANNKLFTTFYFRDQNIDKVRQQKAQLLGFKDDRLRLEPILFSDVISYIESTMD